MKRPGIFRTILVNFAGKPTCLIHVGAYSGVSFKGYENAICITPHLLSIGEIRGHRDLLVDDLWRAFDELERELLKAEADAKANPAAWPMFPPKQKR